MIRIMFVCTGNICRSPMAELVMKQLVRKEMMSTALYRPRSAGSKRITRICL